MPGVLTRCPHDLLCLGVARSSLLSSPWHDSVRLSADPLSTRLCLTVQVMCRGARALQDAAAGAGSTSGNRCGLQEQEVDELADMEENDDLVHTQRERLRPR